MDLAELEDFTRQVLSWTYGGRNLALPWMVETC